MSTIDGQLTDAEYAAIVAATAAEEVAIWEAISRPLWVPHKPHPRQALFLAQKELEVFFGGQAGGGKDICLNTLLPTPTGWITMGDIQVGDQVIDEKGQPCNVVWASEILHNPCYRVCFDDGSEIIAGEGHQWVTSSLGERFRSWGCTPERRARRRAVRPKRGTGKKPWLALRNSQVAKATNPPTESVKTTKEIADTLKRGPRFNHAIKVAQSLQLPEAELLIDPYVLGAWLGDGTSKAGAITGIDEEIFQCVANAGYTVTRYSAEKTRGVLGLQSQLKQLGVFNNKHIPPAYLRASSEQRLAVLQGLCDTDGHATDTGQCEITLTNKRLVEDVHELCLSLGIKTTIRESGAYLKRRYISQRYRMKFTSELPLFKLGRKLIRQKRQGFRGCHKQRYITAVEPIPSVPTRCIQVDSPSHCYLAGRSMIPTHNSDALLMAALKYVDVKGYNAILFRRTLADLKLPEALMARSHEWLNGTPAKWNAQEMKWAFPSGATLQFGYLDSDDDRFRYQSSAYQYVGFDELAHFTELTYRFMFSRLRKLAGVDVPLRVRSAGNPGGRGHLWVRRRFIPDGWRPEMAEEEKAWSKVIEYEEDEIKSLSALLGPGEALPSTRVFIPSRIDDNPSLDRSSYVQSLYQLDRVTREQMLRGDWSVQVTGRQRFYGPAIEAFRPKAGVRGEVRLTKDMFGLETPAFYPLENGALEVWEPPQPGRIYAAGVDTAEGKEMSEDESRSDPDFSVCELSDALTGVQVARLRYRQSEAVFGSDLYALLRWYHSPFVVPEVKGGYGRAMLNKLLDSGYEQALIFNRHLLGELQGLPPYRGVVSYHDLGWNTNDSNRNLMISLLDDAILKHEIEEYDSVGVDELRHFCYDARGKAQAENGWHDDTVIAKALREVARIFAKKLAPMRARQASGITMSGGQHRKYGQPIRKDAEEEAWWRNQARRQAR